MENNRHIRVIIESHIPFADGRLPECVEVTRLAPGGFTPAAVADADALIIRTRTRVSGQLLAGSRVSFVATATIGTDHIDLPWCANNGVTVTSAPGCNAPGVAQYVISSLMEQGFEAGAATTIGIVGCGNVGRILERWVRNLGMKILVCDPPRARHEGPDGFCSLDEIAREADVITFHTPLTRDGDDATYHMISRQFLEQCKRRPLIINAARGPVADTAALVDAVASGKIVPPVIDCWENEPNISRELLDCAGVATPHIAGYSLEGKMRATQMALDAFTAHFGLEQPTPLDADLSVADAPSAEAIARSYSPKADTAVLRSDPSAFELLRNNYDYRPEPR